MPGTVDLSCKDIELVYGASGCKCARYREFFPGGDCEGCSVSDHSPGVVENDEILYRFLLPGHLKKGTSEVQPNALQGVETLGLSVFRERYVSLEGLAHRAQEQAKRRDIRLSDLSLAMARCGDVKAILLDGERGYCVYDTATEHDPAHVDICRALAFPPGTPDQRVRFGKLRLRLSKVFTAVRGFPG